MFWDLFRKPILFQFQVGTFPYSFLCSETLAFFATWIKVPMVIRMGKEYLSTHKSLKAREKARSLYAMNHKTIDIKWSYAPLFESIRYESIGIIKKGRPMVLDVLLRALRIKIQYINILIKAITSFSFIDRLCVNKNIYVFADYF